MSTVQSRLARQAIALCLCSSAAWAGVPANNDCSTPTIISGAGLFPFDLVGATTGQEGQNNTSCTSTGDPTIADDVWYCWTATCTGLVQISTCGLTNIDTTIALYIDCDCPSTDEQAFCCNDDACGVQSGFNCEVQCGQKYLIQIGHKPGTPPGTGQFRILCEGEPCQPPQETVDCCGGKPEFLNSLSPNFTEVIAAATHDRPCLTDYVLHVIDLKNQGSAPANQNWATPYFNNPSACPAALPPHPTWTKGHLGTVYGVAIDDAGNIYVAHSSVYAQFDNPTPDTLGVGGAGAIYKVDSNTSVASLFNNTPLPNNPDPNIAPVSESYPGLGNLAFSCDHQMLYVSNNEDGRIYRLDTAGNVLSAFDHATGTVSAGGLPEAGDPPGFVPPLERVWAVQPHNGRLYYSTWDSGPNPIWSVALNVNGNFVPSTQQQESFTNGGFGGFHQPVSDITFSPSGCMLTAERTMVGPSTSGSHQSRALEWCPSGTSWSPGNVFTVGVISGNDSAGGIDYDAFNNRVFVSADAIQFGPQYIYGLQGLPGGGGTPASSILIDLDQETTQIDKHQIGSVEVSCHKKCMEITDEQILCQIDPAGGGANGCYTYTFTVTNNSGQTANYVLLPNQNITPNVVTLNPPLADGQSQTVTTTICNVTPGQPYCFGIILADQKVNHCCAVERCVDIPTCICFQPTQLSVGCTSSGNGYTLSFTLQNLTPDVIEHLFLFPPLPPDPNSNLTITPNYIDIPSTPPFALTGPHNVTLSFPTAPAPGDVICIRISMHNSNLLQCCSKQLCFTIPDCPQGVTCPADITGNGVVDVDDLLAVITGWGMSGGPADIAPTPFGDGVVDVDDLLLVINSWGPCKK